MNEHGNSCSGLWRYVAALAALALIVLLFSCGGKGSGASSIVIPDTAKGPEVPAELADGPDLVMLKDVSGAPTGVKVYWWRLNDNDVLGYYLYRDTQPIVSPDPALRVNGGVLIPQPGEGESAVLFDDLFAAEIGVTYYYRVSAVDLQMDESALSIQRSITISAFFIESFTPIRGPVGARVTINGEYFGEYNDQTDAVYFTGVRNDKGPSALYVDDILANILSWENTRIEAFVPLGATIGAITVVSNNIPQETNGDFECTSPYILSVSPDPAAPNAEINFYGANFGQPDGMNKLVIDDAAYGGLFSYWSDDHVVATLPIDAPPGLIKLELLIGSELTNPYYCDILLGNIPVIQKVSPGYGIPDSTGVEIIGMNFGDIPDNLTVWFNGVEVPGLSLDYVSDTVLNLIIPAGAARIGEVYVEVDDGMSTEGSNYYLYHTLPETVPSFDDGIIAGRVMGEYSDVVLGPDGKYFAIFTQSNETGGPSSLYLAYEDAGDVAIDELITTYKECRYPRVALDSSGVVHFAYQTYGWTGQVRYGTWDNGNLTDELVYQESSTNNPGAYLDMVVLDDGTGGIDRILVWSNELDEVMCGYMLDGASGWTTDIVYTADGAYSEEAGYFCSIDLVELIGAPPPWRTPSQIGGGYYIGVSFGLYSEENGAHWDVLLSYSSDLDIWDSDVVGTSIEPVTETVMCWHKWAAEPFILWATNEGVSWSYYDGGWSDMWVAGNGDQYGAALGLYIDESTNEQYAYGNEGEDACFFGTYDPYSNEWDTYSEPIAEGRRAAHVGRGGTAMDFAGEELVMSVYDPDMRDVALIVYDAVGMHWEDIADGFATPGYDLSNRAVVCDSSGNPHVVFGDIDPVTGERTLWVARLYDGTPPSPPGGWEYDLIDSAASGTLGNATMAVDEFDDFHIAYLKGENVMYVKGSFGSFGSAQSVFTGGAVTTAPRIALGPSSSLDINILAPEAGSPWRLWLIESNNGMASHSQALAMSCASAITQYDLAVRHDGDAVAAAYLDSPDNELTVWEERSGLRRGFAGTGGMNAGVTLTLDEDMRYWISLWDAEDTEAAFMLSWDTNLDDYALEQFAASAEGSWSMSQWRTQAGSFLSYIDQYFDGSNWWTECDAFFSDTNWFVDEYYDAQKIPVLHTADPFTYEQGVFVYFVDAPAYHNLWVNTGPSIE